MRKLCEGQEVLRKSHRYDVNDAYIYRQRISGTDDYLFRFVRLSHGKVIYETRWKPDYDDLVATDWKLHDRKESNERTRESEDS